MFWFIGSNLAKLFILIIGWKLLDSDIFATVNKHARIILIFSHTSYTDFWVLLLYLLAYPKQLTHVRTLVKPQPFRYMGWLLRRFGAIPATKVEDKQGGAVDRIVAELQSQPKWIFLISPKGTILKRDWRSGYYNIAKACNASIMVTGADYERKCLVVIDPSLSMERDESEAQQILQRELATIVPLFPEEEVIAIRKHDVTRRNIMTRRRLGVIVTVIIGFSAYFLY
jgi:1-acyl-sn-glycerol-3-phosphate acyltransferase